jgi:hypothetical protein
MTPAAATLGEVRIERRRPGHCGHRPTELGGEPLDLLLADPPTLGLDVPKPVEHRRSRPVQPPLQLDEGLPHLAHRDFFPRVALTVIPRIYFPR